MPHKDNNTEVIIRKGFWKDIQASHKTHAHIVMIATKPDIIKQAPLYNELVNRWELVILVHTWQHYDYNLSKWVLREFWMSVDVNLNIYWAIHKKFSLIIHRLWDFLVELNTSYKKIPVPYVHWDTMTATTADKASFLNKFSVVHVEAGIRTFTPKRDFFKELFEGYNKWKFVWEDYYAKCQDKKHYELGSIEPYPEQFDTRWIEASTWFFAVPVELYRNTLVSEWFPEDRITVTWNTVSDAVKISLKKVPESQAFEIYPNMKWKDFIFVTIHRRENTTESKQRFLSIFYAFKKLLEDWVAVCFLALYSSEWAIDNYWLREELDELIKKYKDTFAYWPALAHHHEVIDMISKAWAVVTDSWSMQEEANIVWVPCVTIRFWSDRAETLFAWSNIIAPPVNSCLIADIIKWAISNKNMIKPNLYWENVSEIIVDEVLELLRQEWKLFRLDHERLRLEKYFNWNV